MKTNRQNRKFAQLAFAPLWVDAVALSKGRVLIVGKRKGEGVIFLRGIPQNERDWKDMRDFARALVAASPLLMKKFNRPMR